ncbi:MAG: hypothetical protein M9938_10035 [Solirubrobacterales bacterium]|nr:hypothetical protein [Solirubrobacterales bacterium]
MQSLSGLPNRKNSLTGLTDEGDEIWIIRSISQKYYLCGGCKGEIQIGDEHVVVQYLGRGGGTEHSHWHRRCAEEILYSQIRSVRTVSARESSRDRLERRGRRPAGRRNRPR